MIFHNSVTDFNFMIIFDRTERSESNANWCQPASNHLFIR